MNEATLFFKLLIILDYLFNVITGGGLQTCFSTRAYYKEQTTGLKRWVIIRKAVDRVMCEKNHCLKSHAWEMKKKRQWLTDYNL